MASFLLYKAESDIKRSAQEIYSLLCRSGLRCSLGPDPEPGASRWIEFDDAPAVTLFLHEAGRRVTAAEIAPGLGRDDNVLHAVMNVLDEAGLSYYDIDDEP